MPETFEFDEALRLLKQGFSLSRSGWNGKGMCVELQRPDANSKMSLPYLYLNYGNAVRVPWMASQTDLLADDWMKGIN